MSDQKYNEQCLELARHFFVAFQKYVGDRLAEDIGFFKHHSAKWMDFADSKERYKAVVGDHFWVKHYVIFLEGMYATTLLDAEAVEVNPN